MKISVLIIARNEESVIEDTLKSVSFVDEIVVILDRSAIKQSQFAKNIQRKFLVVLGYEGKEEIMVLKNVLQIDS